MRKKSIRIIRLYTACKIAAKNKKPGTVFTYNDLVTEVGTFGCNTNEIREAGRMFGAWERNGRDAPIIRIPNTEKPIVYIRLSNFYKGGNF
ncbi:hypothetical protein [Staphylococcus simiae]|uniref:Uncharacterized protein n=1 Tax=Staphylococcus simiae CCM 7213 = CCUG 51256 TaxID=911238 RepID=G5JK76_9STAP|nr:hypothetical protein [Staphylococcus simiae]EHJ07406.1 hypothetical protein SS7213T_09439 [Staphylococcus simiae CCM 7213 = CCUG 51256]PNZ09485.1 hypothetical protein CD113_12235 [Staphylococcus simiae]SNV54616.1 Uncharacterised protein [Staphylococcus simiae]